MQKNQKFNLEVTSENEVDSQCSCLECESASCFVKRRDEHCTCASRASSGLHTLASQSQLLTETKHSISKPLTIPQVQIVSDLKKKLVLSSKDVITRQIKSEFVKSNKNIITDSTTTIFKKSNTSFIKTLSHIKDRIEKSKDKGSNVYCYRKKAYRGESEIDNLTKNPARQNMSAAVDHCMLHQELKFPFPKTKISSAKVNLSAADIYNKIKEAYKACSCEVCDCVVGKSLQSELCACKPCECHDCANLSECTPNYIGTEVIQKHDEKCFCLLCDKKSCKVNNTLYDGHHDNFEVKKLGNDCDCKYCECINCTARSIHRTLVVAPVGGELQPHNGCRCAPCECFECRHRYGVTNNGQHEISTGVNRHPQCHCEVCDNEACIPDNNQSCRCVRQSKVMSKPVEQDSHDYDIRTAQVTYNNKGICKGNFETLAMFATLPTSYTKRTEQSKQCNCDNCECLNCEYFVCTSSQNVSQLPLQSHQLDQEVRGKLQYFKPEVLEQLKLEQRSALDMCGYIDSDNLLNLCVKDETATKKLNKECSFNHVNKCNNCEFAKCGKTEIDNFKNRGEASGDIFRLVKSRRQTRLRDHDPLIQSCIDTLESNKIIFQQHDLLIYPSKSSTSVDNFGELHHPAYRQECYGSHRIFCPNFEIDSVVHKHISESANEFDLRRNNKQTLNSSHSLLSSKSLVKESESVTPVTNKLKSRESSCNSSGYDYPDYLAHFPKLTIKTCSNNIIQCDRSNNAMLNMDSNNTIQTNFSVRDQKYFQSQTITARSSKNTKVNCKASQTFDYDIQKHIFQIRNCTKETRKTYNDDKNKVNPEKESDKSKTDSASSITTNISAKVAFNEEYIRVQKTLRDAREYSQHLLSLFEKYEKANKEFESVSERIKNSNYSIDPNINKNVNRTNISKDTFVVHEVPTKDSECTFTSAFDEIDIINKQQNCIVNRNSFNFSEKPLNFIKNQIFANSDRGNHDYAFNDTNHIITQEKESIDVQEQKRSLVKKNIRHIEVTKRAQDLITPQRSISQLNKSQGVFAAINDSNIVVLSDSQSLDSHRHFQESVDTKVIDTSKNTDGDCHDKSNISQANNIERLGQDKKPNEERKSVTVKRDFNNKTSTTFPEKLSTKCPTELVNISKIKSILKTKTENVDFPVKDIDKNFAKEKHEVITSIPTPHESDARTVTEDVSLQPIYEHATNDNKSEKLKCKSIVKTKTESSKLLLENVDIDRKSHEDGQNEIASLLHSNESDGKPATKVNSHQPLDDKNKALKSNTIMKMKTESSKLLLENVETDIKSHVDGQKEIASLLHSNESDGKAAIEVISHKPLDKYYDNKNKALQKVQSEIKRILDLPFLQVVENQKKISHDKNCEAMKVTTLIAQRISDHSVAVKWKAPSLFTHVKGYEVLIDGRFVQKISNPLRRMAVISCLPHADTVLLTVRTVVTVPVADHYPAATLVYHTRKKSETFKECSRNSLL